MKILALECSAKPGSVAITDNGKLLSEFYCNVGLTHSQTLMPMVENALECCELSLNDIDGFGISAGPGSFTGIRIGISALKGMAFAENKPCVAVSTLESMAYNASHYKGIIACCMDARCNQCYCALFLSDGKEIFRILEDSALSMEDFYDIMKKESENRNQDVIIVGDGAELFYSKFSEQLPSLILSDGNCRYQSARFVAKVAERDFINNKTITQDKLLPIYLRLPQAERELKKKMEASK